MPGMDSEHPAGHQKNANFDTYKKTAKAVKHSIAKPISLNFVKLSSIFCPRLFAEAHFHF